MRKEKKTAIAEPIIARQQSYHEGGNYSDRESYAFQGFRANKYFTSDRFITLDEHFNRPDGKALCGYGLEIECENTLIRDSSVRAEVLDKIIFPYFPGDLFKMQSDGSLNNGTECITQVMTKEFIRNNYGAWKIMYDTYFPALGFSASASGNCGMHCNISLGCFGRDKAVQDLAIRKLFYIVNKHYRLMARMLNRDLARTQYCSQMNYDNAKGMDLEHMPASHGISMNYSHYRAGRIEIRLVGGQSSYACFRNTMEVIFFLVEHVKKLSWKQCDSITEIFKGCNKYVLSRAKRTFQDDRIMSEEDYRAIEQNADTTEEYL